VSEWLILNGPQILGTTFPVFIGVTLVSMGSCAILMGREVAHAWRPASYTLPYALLLGVADRLIVYAMFDGQWSSVSGFAIDTLFILLAAALAYQVTFAAQMVRQYPWLYRRSLLFSWRKRQRLRVGGFVRYAISGSLM